jgi:excisionase family DNA binding protein
MSIKDEIKDAVREVLREEFARPRPSEARDPLFWFTVEEVAKRTGFKPDTIRDYCVRGKIRAVRKGGAWRIKAGDLDAFMRSSEAVDENVPDPRDVAFAIVGSKG